MNDHDTPSDVFLLATRHSDSGKYEHREVNLDFEKKHLAMFKIMPPTIGCLIDLECLYKIDAIKYSKDGKIILYCTSHF